MNDAIIQMQTEEPQDVWDQIAPNTQSRAAQEQAEIPSNSQLPENNDIGNDMGLAVHDEENIRQNYEMLDTEYLEKMVKLNMGQIDFL